MGRIKKIFNETNKKRLERSGINTLHLIGAAKTTPQTKINIKQDRNLQCCDPRKETTHHIYKIQALLWQLIMNLQKYIYLPVLRLNKLRKRRKLMKD